MEYKNPYNAGHPWYYKLGGRIKKTKAILRSIKTRKYEGYLADDIKAAASKAEPRRSEVLRLIKTKVLKDYKRDLSRYRHLAHEMRQERIRKGVVVTEDFSNNLHTSISLKHNHLYNDLAHLLLLERELSLQPDLFGS